MPPWFALSPEKNPTPVSTKISRMTFTSIEIHFFLYSILFLSLPFHGNSQSYSEEHTILLKLKQHWSNPPSINHWTPSSSSSYSTHCDWSEITCTNGSISGLALMNKSITAGTVPPFICNLKNLITLDLQYNYLSGQFPKSLYNCSKLEYVVLSNNYFFGSIPDDVDLLSPQLRYLNLSATIFTRDIPAAIGWLPELRSLLLFQCEFHSGLIPTEIGNLSKLEVLDISYNDFIPLAMPSSFTQLKKLKQLWMRRSRLIGEIPKSIGNLTALEVLDLSSNDLSGNIPSGLFLLKNLTTLYLYKNHLSGAIPKSVEASKMENLSSFVEEFWLLEYVGFHRVGHCVEFD
ncbi:hypothetical protein ACSBR2_038485 [Camellia fascicularis]